MSQRVHVAKYRNKKKEISLKCQIRTLRHCDTCDGSGERLPPDHAAATRRINAAGPSGKPAGVFDWAGPCMHLGHAEPAVGPVKQSLAYLAAKRTGPFLERLASGNGMRVVGISQDDHEATVAFMRRFGLTFPVLLDSVRTGYVVSNGFGISSVPSTFVVERDQKLSTAYAGFSKADLELLGARMGVQPFRAEERVPAFRAG